MYFYLNNYKSQVTIWCSIKKKKNFYKLFLLNDLHWNVSILFLIACDFFAINGIITQYLSQSTIQKNYLQNQTYKKI